MPTPPQLTDEQRRQALRKAAEVRKARARLKADLKDGVVTLPQLLSMADDNEVVAKTKVLTVLESLPGVGKVTARRTMERIGIAESRRVAGLGPQQQSALLEVFGD